MRWRAAGTHDTRGRWWVQWEAGTVTGTPWVVSELYDRAGDLAEPWDVMRALLELAGWAHDTGPPA